MQGIVTCSQESKQFPKQKQFSIINAHEFFWIDGPRSNILVSFSTYSLGPLAFHSWTIRFR
jgi:hypothetical protein